MKILLKYNEKFFKIPVKKMVELFDKYGNKSLIAGFEIEVSSLTKSKIEYLNELAKVIKSKKQILQMKGISLDDNILLHYDFLKFYDSIAKILDKKITVIYDPIVLEDKAESIYKTNVILKRLIKNIKDNAYNLEICIGNVDEENLQFTPFDVINTIKIVDSVKFSYNIGKLYLKENQEYTLNKALEKKLKTVHIKNVSNINSLRYMNIDFDKLFYYLNEIEYNKTLVIDIDIDNIKGENLENKIISSIIEIENVDKINKMYQI